MAYQKSAANQELAAAQSFSNSFPSGANGEWADFAIRELLEKLDNEAKDSGTESERG